MMNIILFDDERRAHLLPLTFTRPVADLRIGILTIKEKWERFTKFPVSFLSQDYLQEKFPLVIGEDNLLIAGSLLPSAELWEKIQTLEPGEALSQRGELLAARNVSNNFQTIASAYSIKEYELTSPRISDLWDIFSQNGQAISFDFKLLTSGRVSQTIDKSNTVIGTEIFVEEGAKITCAVLNASQGPIYIGKNAEIWEGSLIRGPFALCENASVKMGAKIYGATTIGPESRVGGEISNVVIQGYSNKGHDGFLGNAVLGEWCNIGADSNNSNLKNNYAEVKVWSYPLQRFVPTGLQFCGLIMGDHSKCGINTMFNTGTVVGVSANIFGAGFPRNFIPSFTWGGPQGSTEYQLEKASETARLVMIRRGKNFDGLEQDIFNKVFELTKSFRQGG
jgi:UDP-N-acetylglucosamine diphosphorylase/glucosamine-1-phosphate N-acetyltransferase